MGPFRAFLIRGGGMGAHEDRGSALRGLGANALRGLVANALRGLVANALRGLGANALRA